MIFLITVTTVFSPQYFWKGQFDTFNNQCNVLRAVFCDYHNFFVVERLHDFLCEEIAWFFLYVKRFRGFFCVKRLHHFLCEKVAWFFCVKRFFSEQKVLLGVILFFWWKLFFWGENKYIYIYIYFFIAFFGENFFCVFFVCEFFRCKKFYWWKVNGFFVTIVA